MKIKILGIALISVFGAQASFGEIINNGDAASSAVTVRSHVEWQDVDQGWVVSDTNKWNLTDIPGKITAPVGGANGIAQINSITASDTGNSLTFKFDWTPAGTANGADTIQYELIGWKLNDPGDLPTAVNDGFRAIQNGTFFVSGFNKKTEFVNLFDGTKYPDIADGGTDVPAQELAGAVGVTTNVELTIDISTFGAGYDTVSDYDLMGVRFHIKGQHSSMAGSTLDNVSLVASGAVASNLPPVFTSDPIVMPQTPVEVLFTNSIAGYATDPDGDPMTFSKVDGPDWLTVATNGFIAGTPGVTNGGNNYFTVQVAAVDGTNTTTLQIPVLADDPPAASGEMLVNWNMSTPTHGAIAASIQYQHIDAGWVADSSDVWSLTTEPGKMVMAGTTTGQIGDGLGQIVTHTGSGGGLNLKFDWTAGTNAAVAVGSTNLLYQVIGWKMSTNAPPAGQPGFQNINGTSANVSSFGTNSAIMVVDLLTGDAYTNTIHTAASQGVFGGVPGVNVSADLTIDLSGYGAGFNDISDYDYIGIRFNIGSTQPGGHGSVIDNVSLIAGSGGVIGYDLWAQAYPTMTGGKDDDSDGDLLSNFHEYALNGNPTNGADTGMTDISNDGSFFDYAYVIRTSDGSLVYTVRSTDNLTSPTWTTNAVTTPGTTVDADYQWHTNSFDMTGNNQQFIQLLIE